MFLTEAGGGPRRWVGAWHYVRGVHGGGHGGVHGGVHGVNAVRGHMGADLGLVCLHAVSLL